MISNSLSLLKLFTDYYFFIGTYFSFFYKFFSGIGGFGVNDMVVWEKVFSVATLVSRNDL